MVSFRRMIHPINLLLQKRLKRCRTLITEMFIKKQKQYYMRYKINTQNTGGILNALMMVVDVIDNLVVFYRLNGMDSTLTQSFAMIKMRLKNLKKVSNHLRSDKLASILIHLLHDNINLQKKLIPTQHSKTNKMLTLRLKQSLQMPRLSWYFLQIYKLSSQILKISS